MSDSGLLTFREDTRRGMENTYFIREGTRRGREEHLFVHEGPLRTTKNTLLSAEDAGNILF